MSFYGKWDTWKVVYYPKNMSGAVRGVAFVEAGDRAHASFTFQQQYAGQYHTISSIEKVSL